MSQKALLIRQGSALNFDLFYTKNNNVKITKAILVEDFYLTEVPAREGILYQIQMEEFTTSSTMKYIK